MVGYDNSKAHIRFQTKIGNFFVFLSNLDMSEQSNKKKLEKAIQKDIVFAKQVHSNIVINVQKPSLDLVGDGLITNNTDLALGVVLADCLGVCLVDEQKQIMGIVHAGHRGMRKDIVGGCVDLMVSKYACSPKNIKAVFSPCICTQNYEVSEDFSKGLDELLGDDLQTFFIKRDNKFFFDLRGANENLLRKKGVSDISHMRACTFKDDSLFSHRQNKTKKRLGFCVMRINML